MTIKELERAAEAVLFAAGGVVTPEALGAALGIDASTAKAIALRLRDAYADDKRGVQLITLEGGFQLCSNPAYYDNVAALAEVPRRRALSNTLLETLAIAAYRQPVTKADIEDIRGVSADHAVNRLMELGLLREAGRAETPGRPILFATTDDFLRYFGYENLSSLPGLPVLSQEETELEE